VCGLYDVIGAEEPSDEESDADDDDDDDDVFWPSPDEFKRDCEVAN